MKYRILFFAGFLIYPVISWEYTILYHYLEAAEFLSRLPVY